MKGEHADPDQVAGIQWKMLVRSDRDGVVIEEGAVAAAVG